MTPTDQMTQQGTQHEVAIGCRPADALLIAAAPELLAALRLVAELAGNSLDHAHPRNSASISAIECAARAAIAKATGVGP